MSIQVGDIEVVRIVERAHVPVPVRNQFPGLTEAEEAELLTTSDPRCVDGHGRTVTLSFHSWLIRTSEVTILVDPAVGNGKSRPTIPYLDRLETDYLDQLEAAGVLPSDVDVVVSTHHHVDHVGWNTRFEDGHWVPTFGSAIYVWGRSEFEWFHEKHARGELVNHGAHLDSVLPVLDAGLSRLIDDEELDGYELASGITLESARGHTPGSLIVRVDGGSSCALMVGDAIHHPYQVGCPSLANHADVDPRMAERTRRRILEECWRQGAILAPGHFPDPGVGVVVGVEHPRFRFLSDRPSETSEVQS